MYIIKKILSLKLIKLLGNGKYMNCTQDRILSMPFDVPLGTY